MKPTGDGGKRICTLRNLLFVFLFMCSWLQGFAQKRDVQLWFDHQLTYAFKNRYTLENVSTYQTVLDADYKWRNFGISPSFEYVLIPWIDLTSEVSLTYTQQDDAVNSFDIAPMIGARFHLTQNKRIDTRFLIRHQTRFFRQIEEEDWQVSNRTRLRGEVYISINGPNLFTDKLWYCFLDYEEFLVLDEQVDERFANRRRARIGLGYRLNYKHRFELSYTVQSSRNELDDGFIRNDDVIQARYKIYLNPARPAGEDD